MEQKPAQWQRSNVLQASKGSISSAASSSGGLAFCGRDGIVRIPQHQLEAIAKSAGLLVLPPRVEPLHLYLHFRNRAQLEEIGKVFLCHVLPPETQSLLLLAQVLPQLDCTSTLAPAGAALGHLSAVAEDGDSRMQSPVMSCRPSPDSMPQPLQPGQLIDVRPMDSEAQLAVAVGGSSSSNGSGDMYDAKSAAALAAHYAAAQVPSMHAASQPLHIPGGEPPCFAAKPAAKTAPAVTSVRAVPLIFKPVQLS